MDSDYEDIGSDISEFDHNLDTDDEDGDSESDEDNDAPVFLWSHQNPDICEFPDEIQSFTEHCGPINPPPRTAEPVEYFRWLAADGEQSIVGILVEETNRYAHQLLDSRSDDLGPHARLRKWEDVSVEEMSAFLGLWLSMGIVKKPTIPSYWQNSNKLWLYNIPSFSKVMTRDRFQSILQCLHANNNTTAVPRGHQNHDPAHKIRRVLDLVNKSFKDKYAAARDLTVDESMVGHKGRDYIVQYMPAKKAHRWGAKLWVLAESDTGYTLSIDLYAGKFT